MDRFHRTRARKDLVHSSLIEWCKQKCIDHNGWCNDDAIEELHLEMVAARLRFDIVAAVIEEDTKLVLIPVTAEVFDKSQFDVTREPSLYLAGGGKNTGGYVTVDFNTALTVQKHNRRYAIAKGTANSFEDYQKALVKQGAITKSELKRIR